MTRLIFVFAILVSLATGSYGQSIAGQQRADKSTEVLEKVDKLNIMNQLLPLVMTKEQLKKILPVIEKARQKVRDIQKVEADELRILEPKIDAKLKEALEKGTVPTPDFIRECSVTFAAMRTRRNVIAEENAQNVAKILKDTLNAGQIKAAANSLNPKQFNPNFKPDEMTEQDRLELFAREIILHPFTYDLLVQMSK